MMKYISIFLLLISCTFIRPGETIKREIVMFDDSDIKKEYFVNKQIQIKYRSCLTGKPDKNYFVKPLKEKFEKKFKVSLIGISDSEMKTFVVKDTSFFVPDETCNHLVGFPITKIKMNSKPSEEFVLDDDRMHIH